jgi:hypothetical protein
MEYNVFLPEYDFDNMLWPVVLTDKTGRVVYKNEFSAKIKLIRKGKNVSCLFKNEADFNSVINGRGSAIIECKTSLGISHAILMSCDDFVIVFFIINTMLIKSLLDESFLETHRITCSTNELIINTYKDICKKLKFAGDEKSNEILKYNSLRFFRASRNYEMYYLSLTKTAFSGKKETLNISEICKTVSERFSKQISALGYRFYTDIKDQMLTTALNSDVFIPLFLETATLALKIAYDRSCTATVSEFCGMIRVDYTFGCESVDSAKLLYSAELDFIKVLSENANWKYSGITSLPSGNCNISFSLPITKDFTPLSSDNIFISNIRKDIYHNITDSIVSAFYFE